MVYKKGILINFTFCFTVFTLPSGTYHQSVALADYGRFEMKLKEFKVIIPPKFKDYISVKAKVYHNKNGTTSVGFNVHVKKHLGNMRLRLRCLVWDEAGKKYNLFLTKNVKNMCEANAYKEIFSFLPTYTADCGWNPGRYSYSIADYNQLLQLLTLGKFFYGKYWTMTEIFSGKLGRFVSFNITSVVVPV